MEDYITRKEYDEHSKRMEDEHKRQNNRIRSLEEMTKQINDLTVAVKEMAINMKSMLEEQKEQGKRLEVLESRDGEVWRKVSTHIITAIISIIIGYVFSQIGI